VYEYMERVVEKIQVAIASTNDTLKSDYYQYASTETLLNGKDHMSHTNEENQ